MSRSFSFQFSSSGSGSSNAFTIIQPDSGTSPTATSGHTTLTLTSSDSSISITGNSVTNTIDLKIGSTLSTSFVDILALALGTTQVTNKGLLLENTTAAAAGAQQISPAIAWKGRGWKTNATAASQSVDFRSYLLPVQGTANPLGRLIFQSSVNAGSFTTKAGLDTNGLFYSTDFTSDSTFLGTSGNEKFGFGAIANGGNCTAIGSLASATGSNSTALGLGSIAANSNDVAIGINARTGNGSVAIGASALAQGNENVAIGHGWNLSGGINNVAIGGNGTQINSASVTLLNPYNGIGFLGDSSILIGGATICDSFGIAIGYVAQSSQNGVAIGDGAQAAPSAISIGQSSITNYSFSMALGTVTTLASDQAIIGFLDTYFNDAQTSSADPCNLHAADAASSDQTGGSFNIFGGGGRGDQDGGDITLNTSPRAASSGSSPNTFTQNVRTYSSDGRTTFLGSNSFIADPILATSSSIDYPATFGAFTQGRLTNGITDYWHYHIYAGVVVGPTTYWSSIPVEFVQTDNNSTVTINGGPTSVSASETGSGIGYLLGDVIDYLIYDYCQVGGQDLYSLSTGSTSITITNPTTDVNLAWTDTSTFPIQSLVQNAFIARQVNGGGYNDHQFVSAGTGALFDNNTSWISGGTPPGSTVVQDICLINMGWTNPPNASVIKVVFENSGSPVAQNLGLVTTFTDDGSYAFSDSTTVTPNQVTATSVILAAPVSPIQIFGYPTSSSGLSSGAIWVDTGAGYVLKVVP